MDHVSMKGAQVPALGFGTWELEEGDCKEGVRHALELGYRHVDTAQIYGNEAEVGAGIAAASVPREDIWLTTKVWYEKASADQVKRSTEESLEKLGTEYVDLLLFHWPNDATPMEETLGAMTDLQQQGLTKHIGVSNFTPTLLKRALKAAPIAALQVEYHPFLAQEPLLALCREHGLMLTAYSPLARGRVLGDPTLKAIGERHGKSAAQVTLRWLIDQPQVSAVPKAASAAHREANLAIDFSLSDDDRKAIDGLARGDRVIDPSFGPDWENDGKR
jgi:2,5-diketo-D-gluconate reductase B